MRAFVPTLIVAGFALAVAPASAQVTPGYRGDHDAASAQFRSYALGEFQNVMAQWLEAVNAGDVEAVAALYTEDAFIHLERPANGINETEASLRAWLDRFDGVRIGLSDFDASGNLSYGSVRVQLLGSGARGDVDGTMTFILRKHGRDWRIRSQMLVTSPQTVPGG